MTLVDDDDLVRYGKLAKGQMPHAESSHEYLVDRAGHKV